MEIIPAIDLIDGRCVRLTKGDFATSKTYHEDPVAVARLYDQAGIRRLHLVDLDGARARKIVNHGILQKIAEQTNLRIDFGGGVQSDRDIELAFSCGASHITGGSITVKNRRLFLTWLKRYGSEKIILGADTYSGKIAIHGWQETESMDIISFLRAYQTKGIRQTICTDVSKDGALAGPACELYQEIIRQLPGLRVIASGGVSSIADLKQLAEIGVHGVIIGKAIYEGNISLQALADFMQMSSH